VRPNRGLAIPLLNHIQTIFYRQQVSDENGLATRMRMAFQFFRKLLLRPARKRLKIGNKRSKQLATSDQNMAFKNMATLFRSKKACCQACAKNLLTHDEPYNRHTEHSDGATILHWQRVHKVSTQIMALRKHGGAHIGRSCQKFLNLAGFLNQSRNFSINRSWTQAFF